MAKAGGVGVVGGEADWGWGWVWGGLVEAGMGGVWGDCGAAEAVGGVTGAVGAG